MSSDLATGLARAICAKIANFLKFGGFVEVELLTCSEWASVTFAGSRHNLLVVLHGPGSVGAASEFLGSLPEFEIAIPGHIVADVSLVAEDRGERGDHAVLELEALTIEDS